MVVGGLVVKLQGLRYLAVWERLKYKQACKVSNHWLPDSHNVSADLLSRGKTPSWLKRYAVRKRCRLEYLAYATMHVDESWEAK